MLTPPYESLIGRRVRHTHLIDANEGVIMAVVGTDHGIRVLWNGYVNPMVHLAGYLELLDDKPAKIEPLPLPG
jgi:hypothetical protein